jgi:tetratricopeptide (TPR) repeat protein
MLKSNRPHSSFLIPRPFWWLLPVVLLAPFWANGLPANAGFLAWQQGAPATAQGWWLAPLGPEPRAERLRLASVAALRLGDATRAAALAAAAVRLPPDWTPASVPVGPVDAPLAWLQLGEAEEQLGARERALAAWERARAARYFCTQAARALYRTAPPDVSGAAAAADTCTALDSAAGDGWLVLGQARAQQGAHAAALEALGRAYEVLLANNKPGLAAVAAATAASVAGTGDPAAAAAWDAKARALAPTVCADPLRPRDPHLDAYCIPALQGP